MTDLPDQWTAAKVAELAGFVTSGSRGWARYYSELGAAFVRVGNVRRRNIVLNDRDMQRVQPPQGSEGERTKLRCGDVLVTITADLGRVGVFSGTLGDAYINQHVALIRLHDPRSAEYLAWFIASEDGQSALLEMDKGTTKAGLGLDDIRSVVVPVAPLPEQRRIVAKLDALTTRTASARAELDRVPALTARYRQAVLSAAFRGELTAEWRIDRGMQAPRPAKLTDIIEAPIRNGLSVRGSDKPPGVRSLRLSALRSGAVDLSDVRFLPISTAKAAKYLLREADVLVSRGSGTKALVGVAALVPAIVEPTIFPDTAFRIRLAKRVARSEWFTLVWNAPQTREQIEAVARTTAGIWKISQADLADVALLLPEPDEQDEVIRRVRVAFAEIDRLAAEAAVARRLLDRLDQAILAKAFRGELVTQDPADEPAAVLLDRIYTERAGTPRRGRKAGAA